jgi:hypothetical protein
MYNSTISVFSARNGGDNRNEYQDYFLGGKGGRYVVLTTLLILCAECHEIWEHQLPGTLRAVQACTGIALTLSY